MDPALRDNGRVERSSGPSRDADRPHRRGLPSGGLLRPARLARRAHHPLRPGSACGRRDRRGALRARADRARPDRGGQRPARDGRGRLPDQRRRRDVPLPRQPDRRLVQLSPLPVRRRRVAVPRRALLALLLRRARGARPFGRRHVRHRRGRPGQADERAARPLAGAVPRQARARRRGLASRGLAGQRDHAGERPGRRARSPRPRRGEDAGRRRQARRHAGVCASVADARG